jgi:hypothetical protein
MMADDRPAPPGSDPRAAGILTGTLRAEMERRRAEKQHFPPSETIRLLVPLCTELAELHRTKPALYVHPSAIYFDADGLTVDQPAALLPPSLPRDRACLAPEERTKTQGGDARATVFSVGAILYEMLTSHSVGPGMRRPSEVVGSVPAALETIMGKALVGDRAHRPGDLAALAQALHNTSPKASIPPPPADESHLDGEDGIDVDISLSLMPPAPTGAVRVQIKPETPPLQALMDAGIAAQAEPDSSPSSTKKTTERLTELKEALEADPRPRYVVVKDGIDHGPFNAVELLQQIATGSFRGEYLLRDVLSSEERPINEWESFEPFAQQAKLGFDAEHERKALDRVVAKERASLGYKAFIGLGAIVLALAAVAGWWYRTRITRDDSVRVADDRAVSVDVDGGLAGAKKTPMGGGALGPGGLPILPGGMSCEAARDRYVEEYTIGGGKGQPDLTAGAYAAVLNRGSYMASCGVPSSMAVNICAAVQNGRAVGVTVRTTPPNAGIAGCVAGHVRGIAFPAHPRLDIAYTTFAAQ